MSEDEEKNVSWFWNENETSPCISLTVLPVDLGYVNKMASVYAMLNDVLLSKNDRKERTAKFTIYHERKSLTLLSSIQFTSKTHPISASDKD